MDKKINIKVIKKDNNFEKRIEARILKKVDRKLQYSSEKMKHDIEKLILQVSEKNMRRNVADTFKGVKKSFYSSDSAIFNSFTEQIKKILLRA